MRTILSDPHLFMGHVNSIIGDTDDEMCRQGISPTAKKISVGNGPVNDFQ
jgi:hypothetical protein